MNEAHPAISMRCPRCDATFEEYDPQPRVRAYACPDGQGSLLRKPDLERALPVAAIAALSDAPASRPGCACPACGTEMAIKVLERHGDRIELDHCGACGSVWFDSGELARSQAPPPSSGRPSGTHDPRARQFAGGAAAALVVDPHVWGAVAQLIASLFDN